MAERTTHFENCRFVFQGGGCRAAALAGAYQEAFDSGANPTAVAGTSAGAIMAALVGAGARPDQVTQILEALDFTQFLAPPDPLPLSLGTRMWTSLLKPLGAMPAAAAAFVRYGGMYSSEPIERWIAEQLRALLPEVHGPVRFKDLVLPTSIVATDLAANSVKVWSREDTPEEPVAFAVRASCSIPVFFQPAVQGSSRFVDGGLLSNLPTFVFASRARNRGLEPVLAFRLLEAPQANATWDWLNLAKQIAGVVVDGATELQQSTSAPYNTIEIPTGSIKATDFFVMTKEHVKQLTEAGKLATRQFFRDEHRYVARQRDQLIECADRYEAFHTLATETEYPPTSILISEEDTEWFWKLFPTVLSWLRQNATVEVVVPPAPTEKREQERRSLMRRFGISVTEVPESAITGYVLQRADPTRSVAVVRTEEPQDYMPYAVVYSGRLHQRAVQSCLSLIRESFGDAKEPPAAAALQVRRVEFPELEKRLRKGVAQYSKSSVSIKLEEVNLADVDLIVEKLRSYKYRQAAALIDVLREAKLDLFEPAELVLLDGSTSIITPPVLEQVGTRYAVIEGNTRVYHCWRNRIPKIHCIVVRGVTAPLPASPVPMPKVLIVAQYLEAAERMRNFDYDSFRRIEGSMR